MITERFVISNPADAEADYLTHDQKELSNFAIDVAHELTYSLVENTNVELVEVTLRWRGEY